VVPAGTELAVSRDGGTLTAGAGVWHEVGLGDYYYQATVDEANCDAFLLIIITVTGVQQFVQAEDVGTVYQQNELNSGARRIPVYLEDTDGVAKTGLTLSGAELKVSKNGGAFATGTGTSGEIGRGAYWYEAAQSELDTPGFGVLRVADAAAQPYIYAFDVVSSPTVVDTSTYTSPWMFRDSVWRWRRRLSRQKCSVISVAIDDNYSPGEGFVLTALALELGMKPGLDRVPWHGGTTVNQQGSGSTPTGN
jgi:hypothetical protein